MNTALRKADLERVLAKIVDKDGQRDRVRVIRAELEQIAIREAANG